MSKKEQYHNGKMGAYLKLFVHLAKRDPTLLDSPERLVNTVKHNMPELKDKSRCPNCEASMMEYIFNFDAWDALLLIAMSFEVKKKVDKGVEFTMANATRVPELPVSHTIKCRTTRASKLGLVVQLRTAKGKRVPGVWVITRRGWQALRGDEVQKSVRVWRDKIEDRSEEKITISQALQSHRDLVEKTKKAGKDPKRDYSQLIEAFEQTSFYETVVHGGKLF